MKTKLIKFSLYIIWIHIMNKKRTIIIKRNNKNMQKIYIFKFHDNFFNIYFNISTLIKNVQISDKIWIILKNIYKKIHYVVLIIFYRLQNSYES